MTEAQKILTKHFSGKARRGMNVEDLIPRILEAMEEYALTKAENLPISPVSARFSKEQSHEVRRLCRDFYLSMQKNGYDHSIQLRVETKAELFLRKINVR